MRATGLALLLGLAAAVPAGAVDSSKPTTPPPCDLTVGDKIGDQQENPDGVGLSTSKANDNADILGAWFSVDAGGKALANILVNKLDKTQPSTSSSGGGMHWYFYYDLKDATKYVHAYTTGGDVTYVGGTLDASGAYLEDGPVKGGFFEGENGVVQFELPDAPPGTTVANVFATSEGIIGANDQAGLNVRLDESEKAPSATVGPCAGGTTTPTTGPVTPTPTTTTPPVAAPATLPLTISGSVSAKKAKKGAKIALKLKASKPISSLKVTIKARNGKGSPFALGTINRLSGSATLKLKLKKALKKGTYAVQATGTVEGKKLGLSKPLIVK